MKFVKERPDYSGIVYCLSRKSTENVAKRLSDAGFSAEAYHVGLEPELENIQITLFRTKRRLSVTTAFGMGIDKSNIRFVIHYIAPKHRRLLSEIGCRKRWSNRSSASFL